MKHPALPFESRFFVRNGLRQHYLDAGSGDPVVMLHGNPTWCLYYRDLAAALGGSHRVIVPDHIGCGLSDKPGDEWYRYTLASRVDDLEALLDSLGARERVTLVLHDWGGMIGMAWACRRPEAVRRLVILNTAAFGLPAGRRLPWSLRLCRTPLGAVLVRGCNAFAWAAGRFCCTRRPMDRALRRLYREPYGSWAERVAVQRFVEDIPLGPGDEAYALVRSVEDSLGRFAEVPALICWGLRDFVFDRHFLAEWRRRLPRAEAREFPDAGHYVLEDAGDEIIPLVSDFLRRNPIGR
ncbi:MAG: alpha/beta fold hydrolase [Elusimicrobia bacterium]|nr:alpha/beta fold hydrolase [Elusimicrobiota bacterium]